MSQGYPMPPVPGQEAQVYQQPQAIQMPQQPPMQPPMQPGMYQQPVYQQPNMYPQPMQNGVQVTVVKQQGSQQQQILTCQQIVCGCMPPQFNACQCLCGCCNAWTAGSGLYTGACCGCYGCNRQGCCDVCCAGFIQEITAPCIFGIVSGCCVGCKMMCN